jgi:acetylglutamate kinase
MNVPQGFRFAGVHAGLKPVRRDVALVASDVPAACAGCFTTNLAAAAPIADARPRVPAAHIRAIVINSGNANALTGTAGLDDVLAIRTAAAEALATTPDAIVTASTGVIGARLPVGKITGAMPALVAALTPAPEPAAEAILTTDTRSKLASRTLELGGRTVTISAIAKGSGMIAPQLDRRGDRSGSARSRVARGDRAELSLPRRRRRPEHERHRARPRERPCG